MSDYPHSPRSPNRQHATGELKLRGGVQLRVAICGVGFTSHTRWAEGLAASSAHDVTVRMSPPERWKWRMQCGGVEFADTCTDAEVVLVDGMLDVSAFAAEVRRPRSGAASPPTVCVYFHENQLTTPFAPGDRDVARGTHWHYGACNYRSLLSVDAAFFNSATQLNQFADALPAMIRQQCPPDTVQWHLDKAKELVRTRCAVLPEGLDFGALNGEDGDGANGGGLDDVHADDVGVHGGGDGGDGSSSSTSSVGSLPVILWNARLEDDKDPATFVDVLTSLRASGVRFQLVVLGTDPTKGQRWYARLREDFTSELLFCGFCETNDEYFGWLRRCNVLISTALHETFGMALVEACRCGVIPIAPNRLSYPEILGPLGAARLRDVLHDGSVASCRDKVAAMLSRIERNDPALHELRAELVAIASNYSWERVAPLYDAAMSAVRDGANAPDAVAAAVLATTTHESARVDALASTTGEAVIKQHTRVITDAADPSVEQYRPKSLRNHALFHSQRASMLTVGERPSVHGGRRAVTRLLEARDMGLPVKPLSFLCTDDLLHAVLRGGDAVGDDGVDVLTASKQMLEEIRGQKLNTGDSIFALLTFPVSVPLADVLANPPIIVLDNVCNAENVGSILRTAFCLGVTSVVASPTAWSALRDTRAARTSMGTLYFHRMHLANDLLSAIDEIKRGGLSLYAAEIGPGAVPLRAHGPDRQWGVVLGNEDQGVSPEIQQRCDAVMMIPQASGDSLNVGHASAIALFVLGSHSPLPRHDGGGKCT